MPSATKLPSDVFAVIAQTSSEGVIIVDRNGVLVFANPCAASMFGYSPDALVGQSISLLIPEELRDLTYAKGPVDAAGLHRSGRRMPLEISFAQARNNDEILIAAFLRDLTEKHWNHARLAAQYAVAEILSSAEDEDTTLSEILSSVGRNLGFAVGNVWMVDDGRLRWHSGWQSPDCNSQPFLDESRRCTFAHNEGLPGRAWAA